MRDVELTRAELAVLVKRINSKIIAALSDEGYELDYDEDFELLASLLEPESESKKMNVRRKSK